MLTTGNKQPDILLLVLDTQRADKLSCYGYGVETSPNLDRLVNDGATQFSKAVAPAQWTVPSHASLFTGLYPSQHSLVQMDAALPSPVVTLAQRLRQAGYFTAGFSHNPLIGRVPNNLNRGFINFQNYNTPGAGLLAFQFDKDKKLPTVSTRMKHYGRFLIAESLGYSQTSPLQHLSMVGHPLWNKLQHLTKRSKAALATKSLQDAAHILINRPGLTSEQPAFVFMNLMGTHTPYAPSSEKLRRFLPERLGSKHARQFQQMVNRWQVNIDNWLDMPFVHEALEAILHAFYDAEVAEQDAKLGKFFDTLKHNHAWENLLVVVMADHGDHLGEKKRLNHAFGVYEPLVHVPLIVRDPEGQFTNGTVQEQVVSTRQVFHTLLTAVNVATPEEEKLSLQNSANSAPELILAEGHPIEWALQRLKQNRPEIINPQQAHKPAYGIFAKGHKLITIGSRQELYDLQEDNLETSDLSQQQHDLRRDLYNLLQTQLAQMTPVVAEVERRDVEDEIVLAQLRRLGYLE
ncbi:MAG: sulfatase [Chloroflexi bacterium]|nr:sulfatase [Chloroflexota bacterium]